jgi:hypothetical protein
MCGIKQDWGDLWEIQDQTPDLKNELLLGKRDAPNLTKQQFVAAMRETIGSGYPRLRSFDLREVKPDKGIRHDWLRLGHEGGMEATAFRHRRNQNCGRQGTGRPVQHHPRRMHVSRDRSLHS